MRDFLVSNDTKEFCIIFAGKNYMNVRVAEKLKDINASMGGALRRKPRSEART